MVENKTGIDLENNENLTIDLLPFDYLEEFKKSQYYKKALKKRIRECKSRNPDLTKQEIEADFSNCVTKENSTYKDALWKFYASNHISFDISKYTADRKLSKFLDLVYEYWRAYDDCKKIVGSCGRDTFRQFDELRSSAHSKAAKYLAKIGQVPNFYIGRTIIQFLSEAAGKYKASRGRDAPYVYRG